ncbi:MAG: thiamine pyrophosphate-binding protein [Azospirillaceae bacterium]
MAPDSHPPVTATGATIIARRLAEAGCRHAFGIPGGEVLSLVDALGAAGIDFVLTKHENAAGFMGEGVWHRNGAPAVLVATLGPGLANAVNVIANAHQDRVPMIVLTGRVDPAEALTYTHQVFDHAALMAPITKASLTACPGGVATVIDKALAVALDGRPGPVHVDLPIGLADAEEPAGEVPRPVRPAPMAPAPGPDLDRARAWLAEAERPLLIAGVDVLTQGAEARVAETARAFGIPLVTTYKAKGVLPEDGPLALGGAGLSPKADKRLLPLVERADLVLLAGYDPIEMRVGWRDPWGPGKRVVELSAVANTHFMHQAAIAFIGDVGAGLAALTKGVAPRLEQMWPEGEPAATRRALRSDFAPGQDWGPAAVFAALRAATPPETVVTVDSGAHRILLSQQWACPAPRTMLQSSGLCTMGSAVPLAIGAKLASPETPVVAVVGDAGLEMGLGELATARDLGLPVVVVVIADRSLALIELKQRQRQLANRGVDFGATDFAAVATAMGGAGAEILDADALGDALARAWRRDTFTVISCPVDRRAYDGAF